MDIHIVISFVVSLRETQSFLKELADLLEILCAEIFLHSHNNWFKELAEVSDSDIGQACLPVNFKHLKAIENCLEE